MKEQQATIEAKTGQQFSVEVLNRETIRKKGFAGLDVAYATNFWAGAWKELLKDSSGNQYGTYDAAGNMYPETALILARNGIDASLSNWPQVAWQRAGEGRMVDASGQPLRQFWTIESAQAELLQFTESVENGGFGGEIMTIRDDQNRIAGFTAYTVAGPENGPSLAQQRFEYTSLLVEGNEVKKTLADLLTERYGGKSLGIFLDFAISETYRGSGLGSTLFDMRMERLLATGAEVMVGRTIQTSPSQYFGNYRARGMEEIAFDPANPDKAIFAVESGRIAPRARSRR